MLEEWVYFELVAEALAVIEFDEISSEKVKELRRESVSELLLFILEYHRLRYRPDFVKVILEKKINFILKATTKAEMTEILAIPKPYYNYVEVVPSSLFSIEEEELIIWFECLQRSSLNDVALARMVYLCKKVLPKEMEDVYKQL